MKNNKNTLKITIALSMLTALSIILGKYLAIRGGDIMRFSLENMPLILAGMAFGPWAGALVGAVADIVGCLMVGYTINPLVTLGAATIGLISGLVPSLLRKSKLKGWLVTALTVALAHVIGSIIIKTAGLAAYYTIPFGILILWRLLNYLIVGVLDGIIVHILLNNKGVKLQILRLKGEEK